MKTRSTPASFPTVTVKWAIDLKSHPIAQFEENRIICKKNAKFK